MNLSIPLQAQQVLDEYVKTGLKYNRDFIDQQLSVKLQNEQYRASKGKYLPSIYFDASYMRAEGGRTIDVPAGDLVNPVYEGLNGLLGTNQYPTDIQNVSEQLLPDNFHETKIRLVQPILNSKLWLNAKAESLEIKIEEAKREALKNKLQAGIKTAYYNYLSATAQLGTYKHNELLIEQLLEFNQGLVRNNKATSEIVLDAKAQKSALQRDRLKAETTAKTAKAFFNYLIGRALDTEITIDSLAIRAAFQKHHSFYIAPDEAPDLPEIEQLEKSLELTSVNAKLAKSYLLPEVNLIGDIGYQGFGYTFDSNQDFYFLRIGLTWPVFQGFQNRSKIQQTQIATEKIANQLGQVKEKIQLEIRRAYYEFQESLKALEAAQTELAYRKKSYQITQNKYRQGKALPITIETSRNQQLTAALQLTTARYAVLIAQIRLEETINQKINQYNEDH